jgi:hypothetical protein
MERSRSLPISPSPSILPHRHIDPDAFPTQQDVTYYLGFVILGSPMRDQQVLEEKSVSLGTPKKKTSLMSPPPDRDHPTFAYILRIECVGE